LELDKKYETAKKDKELTENQGHIKRQQIIMQFIIIGSILIAFFLILVFIQFRQKKAANIKLEFQNQEILAQKEELKTQSENLQIINNQLTEQRNEIEIQRKKLFELNATKDKFFSIMAHDLKNPFNSLLGMSELLSLNAFIFPPEKVQKYAQIMHSSSKQAYTLLENLLSWSRLQTGTLTPKFSNERPSALIGEIKMLLEAAAQSKGIYLISDVIDDDPIVADIEMTKTVLRNLVTNALKFTFPEGTIKIECEKHENEMIFGITDTGIGIEPEHINKLFRIESKLSKNGTADEKGTGLGLILCKEFVEKQQGRIWVESETGKGSCFSFTIPLFTDGNSTS
jgi:signal transduction histidine kinase